MFKYAVAAAVAVASISSYGIALTNCTKTIAKDCPQVAFKVTANGKTVVITEKKDNVYKATTCLKVSKGALVLFGTKAGTDCCYDAFSLYASVKVGKETKKVAFLDQEVKKWSIFGKDLAAAMDSDKSKKYTLESDFGAYIEDDSSTDVDSFDEVTDVNLLATAFGKVKYQYKAGSANKNACGVCTVGSDSELVTPGNYSGWFAGFMTKVSDDDACMTCSCMDIDVFGGTWKAKYMKDWSKVNGWKSAASYVFGSSTLAEMVEADVE